MSLHKGILGIHAEVKNENSLIKANFISFVNETLS
jgi:hypothetical protein